MCDNDRVTSVIYLFTGRNNEINYYCSTVDVNLRAEKLSRFDGGISRWVAKKGPKDALLAQLTQKT